MKFYCPVCEKDVLISGIHKEIILDHKEEERPLSIKCWCPNAREHYQIALDREYNKVPLETKQKFMDLMKTGKRLGDCAKELNLTSNQAGEILHRQIKKTHYIDWDIEKDTKLEEKALK